MADLVAAMASVHLPSLLSAPERFTPSVWEKFQDGFATLRQTLTSAGVDTIVVISDEHFNALHPDAYPAFGVVTAPEWLTDLFGQPHLDQRLIRHVALVGGDLDLLQQAQRQTN